MPNGIIYIARNNSNPSNHYKIGKSDRVDPAHRMRELTAETTNYDGEFISQGYVVVSDVDECERLVHQNLSNERINQRREFFNISLDKAIKAIRITLRNNIINDYLPDINTQNLVSLELGNREIYKKEKHILNFIPSNDIAKLNFHEVCKYADYHNWHWDLSCHGDYCCRQFRHAFYVLLNKVHLLEKYSEDPNFIPNLEQTNLSKSNIKENEAFKLQQLITDIKIQKFIEEIRFPNFLAYIGVAMFIIGNKVEENNRKITKFLIPEFIKLYPNPSNIIKELDEIYYNNGVLDCWKLEIFERLIKSNNQNHRGIQN